VPVVAAGLVFVSSGAVLVLEILGIRLLAPYVGLTLETTTTIIGTVLAGIAAGAALGGRAADRFDGRRMLALLLGAGGLLAMLTVPLARGLGDALRGGGDAAAFTVTLVALFPPAAVLSAVTPTVARMQLHDLGETGSVVGRLSAWATAGGLVGTFATGFAIVPLVATDVAVLVVGGGLVALGIAVGAVPAFAAAAVAVAALTLAAGAPCDAETDYHCARVVDDPRRPTGRTLVLEDLPHSYVDLADPRHLEFDYARWIGDAIDGMQRGPLDALFLGGGGFTLPRYVAATRPGSRSRVLEVDGDLVTLARRRLGLRTGPELTVRVGDARVTLGDEAADSADLVVGDAFGNRAVPWHLTTAEFAAEVRRVLRPDGLYALNVIDHPPLGLVRAEAATLLQAFDEVALVTHPEPDGNFVFLASDGTLPAVEGTRDRAEVEGLAADADPLRDADAPADQLLTPRG
jgi:MFS family permease